MWLVDFLTGLLLMLLPGGITRPRGSLREMEARHPRSTVRRAEILDGPWRPDPGAGSVEFVIANRRGLAFVDAYGHDELRLAPADIVGIELLSAPNETRQHLRVRGSHATRVEFWCPEDAGDAHADLSAALAR